MSPAAGEDDSTAKRGGGVRRALVTRAVTFPVTTLVAFLQTALVIRYTGSVVYGAVMLIANLLALIPFTDLGMGAFVINACADPDRSAEEKRHVVAKVMRVLTIPAAVLVAVALGGTTLWSWSSVLGLDRFDIDGVDVVVATVLVVFAASVPCGVGQRILIGRHRNDLALVVQAGGNCVALALVWLFTAAGAPGVWLAVCTPLGLLANQVVSLLVGGRLLGMRVTDLARGGEIRTASIVQTAAPMLVVMTLLPVAFQFHRIVLSHCATAAELAAYTLVMQFYNPLWSFFTTASASLWPMFAERRKDAAGTAALLRRGLLAFAAAGAVATVGLLVFGRWFGGILSDHQIALSFAVLLGAGVLLTVQGLQQTPGMLLTTPEGLRLQAACAVPTTIAAIGVSWMLAPSLGALAPLLATAGAVAVFLFVPGMLFASRGLRTHTVSSPAPAQEV